MAGVGNTLRGDGLVSVHRALHRLEADSLDLNRARMRFSQPLPSYTSNSSGTVTQSASPELCEEEQKKKELREQKFQQRLEIMKDREASLPIEQFLAQVDEEAIGIWNANPRTKRMGERYISIRGDEELAAIEMIKKRWIEQGIWKDEWDEMAKGRYMHIGRWKHEEPIELESESETDTEVGPLPCVLDQKPQLIPRRSNSDNEKRLTRERRIVRERERDASRPYRQFTYQISKERERIQNELSNRKEIDTADIDTKAYENVKNTWTKRGIWDVRWGILPGMSWKHEWPLDEEAADNPAPAPAN